MIQTPQHMSVRSHLRSNNNMPRKNSLSLLKTLYFFSAVVIFVNNALIMYNYKRIFGDPKSYSIPGDGGGEMRGALYLTYVSTQRPLFLIDSNKHLCYRVATGASIGY